MMLIVGLITSTASHESVTANLRFSLRTGDFDWLDFWEHARSEEWGKTVSLSYNPKP